LRSTKKKPPGGLPPLVRPLTEQWKQLRPEMEPWWEKTSFMSSSDFIAVYKMRFLIDPESHPSDEDADGEF
jgi:hypothetical protein